MKAKSLQRMTIILTILIILSLFLSACSSATGGNKKITITMWDADTVASDHKVIVDIVNRYMKDNPNVTVNETAIDGDSIEAKIMAAVGANNAPDIFVTWAGGRLYSYAKAGKVLDLTSYMNKDNYKDRFMEAGVNNVTFFNKIWAVPVEGTVLAVFFYDKDLFAKYNIQPPTTYDELLNDCEIFKTAGISCFALGNKMQWPGSEWYMYLTLRLGGVEPFLNAANRTNGGSFADPTFIKAGEMLQDLVNKGYFNVGYNTIDTDTGEARQLLVTGKAAMYLNGTWELSTFKSETPDFYSHLGFFAFPAIQGGKDPNDVVGTVGNEFYSISSTSKNPDESFKLIQYLIDDTAVKARVADNLVPPVKNIDAQLSDPLTKGVMQLLNKAQNVQLWYDQYLPPQITQVYLTTSQALFGLTITPQQMCDQTEQAAKAYYHEK